MILLNQREVDSKYLENSNVVIEINSSLSLPEIYDAVRKGEQLPENVLNYKAFQLHQTTAQAEAQNAGQPRAAAKETPVSYMPIQPDENTLDDHRSHVEYKRNPIFICYEKFLLGTADQTIRFTEKMLSQEELQKELAAALGIMPCFEQDTETDVKKLQSMSSHGERLYWNFLPFSERNALPSRKDIEDYEALSSYEKRIINESLVHPAILLSYIRAIQEYGAKAKLTKEAEFLLKAVFASKENSSLSIEEKVQCAAAIYQTQTLYAYWAQTTSYPVRSKKEAELLSHLLIRSVRPPESMMADHEQEQMQNARGFFKALSELQIPASDAAFYEFAQICQREQVFSKENLDAFLRGQDPEFLKTYRELYQGEYTLFLEKNKLSPGKEAAERFAGRQKTPEPAYMGRVREIFQKNLPRVPQILPEYISMMAASRGKSVQELTEEELTQMAKDFDFKNVQVIRPFDNAALYAFADKLDFKNMRQDHLEVFATHLRPCMAEPLLEKGFVEWYQKYKDMNAGDLSAILSQNKEVLSGYGERIQENFYYCHERLRTFDLQKNAGQILNEVRLQRADGDRAKFDRKYPFKFADKELAIKGRHTVAKQGSMVMEMMQPGDLRIFNAGQDTCCCQEYGNAGESCVARIISDPFAAEVAIVKKGTVIAQGFVWVDNAKDTLVFDNVEFANYKSVSFDNRIKDFTDLFAEWAKAMPYANIHIGTGCLAASMAGWGQPIKEEELATLPTTQDASHCYTDYHRAARTIKRNGNMLITAKGHVQITTAPDEPTRWDFLRDNPAVRFLLNDASQSPEQRLEWARMFMEHPTEALQMQVVQRNPKAIEGIENPCTEVQVWIAQNHPKLVTLIKNPCREIQAELVRQDPKSIRNFQEPAEDMMIAAVTADRSLLKYLKDKNPTEAVYLAAVKKDGLAIIDVPEEGRTEEVCVEAVKKTPIAIAHIKEPTENVWKQALSKDPTVIKLINQPSKEQQVYAVTRDASALNAISHPCFEAVAEAVRRNGLLIRNYQNQYPTLRQAAIRQNPFVVTNGVLHSVSNEEYAAAVRQNPAVLRLIRNSETRAAVEAVVYSEEAEMDLDR